MYQVNLACLWRAMSPPLVHNKQRRKLSPATSISHSIVLDMLKTHDDTANVSYYYLDQPRKVAKTVQVSEKCNVDIDEDGLPIGVEVLF